MKSRKAEHARRLVALIGITLAALTSPAAHADLMIQNVTIIDPLAGETPDQDILIGSEVIQAVGPHGSIATFAPVETIDGTGKFLIPALWDAHVHLTFDPEIGDAALPLFVANGITRVRDTGGLLDKMLGVKERASAMGHAAPDIYFSGPLIDGIPRVYDGSPASYPDISSGTLTPEDARQEVDRLADAGVHFLKSYEMLRPETFQALVTRATERGLPVTSHVPLSMDAGDVARAGVRGMEHLRNLDLSCSSEADDLLTQRQAMLNDGGAMEGSSLRASIHAAQRPVAFESRSETRCADLIATMAAHRVFQTPTLALNTRAAFRHFAAKEWQDTYAYLPDTARTTWGKLTENATAAGKDPAHIAFSDWSLSMVRQLHDAGVPIMAGTDTPIGLLTPGFSLHLELERLVQAGLSPQQALATATVRPAEFFNLNEKMGTIEVGKSSDIVLLSANPLVDIRNTKSVDTVFVRGARLSRADLDALLVSATR
ncbi:MAG: amidohydrolase family protein [Parvibaculum sp.]